MSYLMHPWLLVAGICAVSLPVLIHLLNRRRFQVVDWAAMDFLLEADKQSRRRIRLQHWLLLFLRSLAVALVGLLLARPFVPSSFSGSLTPAASVERIIVLDDSLSMQSRWGNESAWEAAKRGAIELIRRLATQHGGKDTCTLLVTSQPDQPLVRGTAMTRERLDDLQSRLAELECGDGAARLAGFFLALTQSLRSKGNGGNRAVYVFSDMRQPDWTEKRTVNDAANVTAGSIESLRQLSELVQGCYVIDAGNERNGNLTVAKVEADGSLVSDVRSALDVTVVNQGTAQASNVAVKLFVGDGLPLVEKIPRLPPGESSVVRFYSAFVCDAQVATDEKNVRRVESRRVRVELKPENAAEDLQAGDSSFYFPARVRCGIRVLLVDGDPGSEVGKSESFYLQRAIAPAGAVKSGVVPKVVNEMDFDSQSLADFDLMFLLNCGQLGTKVEENVQRLKQWVAKGGGLVLMPGDQTEAALFNNLFWQNGQGLSPLKLSSIVGDSTRQDWVGLRLIDNNSLLPRLAGEQQTLIQNVKVFRHWRATAAENEGDNKAEIVAQFSDDEHSPAIAKKTWGDGRVVAFAIPADADWDDWPSSPSYVLLVQELVQGLIADETSRGLLHVGEAIRQPVDLVKFEAEAVLEGPERLRKPISAAAPIGGGSTDATAWQLASPALSRLGFYELSLSGRDGGQENVLFAANAEASEGNLKRADLAALKRQLAGANVRIAPVNDVATLGEAGLQSELWRYLAWLLVAVLASEQLLGWLFGRERT